MTPKISAMNFLSEQSKTNVVLYNKNRLLDMVHDTYRYIYLICRVTFLVIKQVK